MRRLTAIFPCLQANDHNALQILICYWVLLFIFRVWKVYLSAVKYRSGPGSIEERHNTALEPKTLSDISSFSVIPKKRPAGPFGKSGRYFLVTSISTSTEPDGDLILSNDSTFDNSASKAELKWLHRSWFQVSNQSHDMIGQVSSTVIESNWHQDNV